MALSVHDLELAQHLGVEPALGPLTPTLTLTLTLTPSPLTLTPTLTTYWRAN